MGVSLGVRSTFPGCSLSSLLALGLATIDELHTARQEREKSEWASASKRTHKNGYLIYRSTLKPQDQLPEARGAQTSPLGLQFPLGASLVLAPTSCLPEEGSPPMPSLWAQVQPDVGQATACLGHGYITHLWVSCSVREGLAGQKPLCPGPG